MEWMVLPVEIRLVERCLQPSAELGNRRNLERMFTALLAQVDGDEELSWVVSVESTVVRVPRPFCLSAERGSGVSRVL